MQAVEESADKPLVSQGLDFSHDCEGHNLYGPNVAEFRRPEVTEVSDRGYYRPEPTGEHARSDRAVGITQEYKNRDRSHCRRAIDASALLRSSVSRK